MKKRYIIITVLIIGVTLVWLNSHNKMPQVEVWKTGANRISSMPNGTAWGEEDSWTYQEVLALKEKYPQIIGYELGFNPDAYGHKETFIAYNQYSESYFTKQFKSELMYNANNEVIAGQYYYPVGNSLTVSSRPYSVIVQRLFNQAPIPLIMGNSFSKENDVMITSRLADRIIEYYTRFSEEEGPKTQEELLNKTFELKVSNAACLDFNLMEAENFVERSFNSDKASYSMEVNICGIVDTNTNIDTIYFYEDTYDKAIASLFEFETSELKYDYIRLIVDPKASKDKLIQELNKQYISSGNVFK